MKQQLNIMEFNQERSYLESKKGEEQQQATRRTKEMVMMIPVELGGG